MSVFCWLGFALRCVRFHYFENTTCEECRKSSIENKKNRTPALRGEPGEVRILLLTSHSMRVALPLDPHQLCAAVFPVLPRHPSVTPLHTRLQSLDHSPVPVAQLGLYYLDIAHRCPKSRVHRFDCGGPRTAAFL